ncbi:MAG: RluA family pseudouridine synthase [Pseudomonadota bacterium]
MLAPFIYSPPDGPISIIHRDADILVLDKPSGLLTVPGKHEDHADCLERRARAEFPEARIVHRLDMDTSGVIVLAMNAVAHRHLGLQFERRHVAKSYIAEVWGIIKESTGDIDLPLRCDWPNRPRQMVDFEDGRNAETHWRVLDRKTHTTRVALHPKTGRSHQLRVHMLETGHPILGDNLYAPTEALRAANRLHLHAESLELHHPSGGERVTFNSPCPF